MEFDRSLPSPTRSSTRTGDRWDDVDQRERLLRIVGVGGREPDGERDAVANHHQVVLGARLAVVDRVRPGLLASLFARTLMESTPVRDLSVAASPPSQSSNLACSRSQTPTSCQSRSRCQHVVPLPQPSSFGSNRQGQPVWSTKMIPPSAAHLGDTRATAPRLQRLRWH
jgi:hypothetical protein